MERTSKIRSDFHPSIKAAVRANFEATHSYFLSISRNDELVDNICSKGFSGSYHRMDPIRSLAIGIAEAHANLDIGQRVQLQMELIESIAKWFRAPMSMFADKLKFIVSKFNLNYLHKSTMQLPRCLRGLLRDEVNSTTFALAMYHTMGYSVKAKIGLGSLLTNYNVFPYFPGDNQTVQQSRLSKNVEKIFSTMLNINKEDEQVSTKNFFGYFGPRILTHQLVPDITGSEVNNLCDFTKEPNRFSQPCSSDRLSTCCQLEMFISNQRENVLRFMKYTIGPQSSYTMDESEIDEAILFSNVLDYLLDSRVNHAKMKVVDPTVITCWFGLEYMSNVECPFFGKAFTRKGIGYSFNARQFWSMYKRTKGNEAFYKQMRSSPTPNHTVYHNTKVEGNGKQFSLTLIVLMNGERTSLALHEPTTIADIHNEAINLVPGMLHDISVVPSSVFTDSSGLNLSPTRRECLAKWESNNLKIFQTYSQSACLFECQLKMAITVCNCSTWDYPVLDESVNYCTVGRSTNCFKSMMADTLALHQCDCPNECSVTQYNVKTNLSPLSQSNEFFSFSNHLDPLSRR